VEKLTRLKPYYFYQFRIRQKKSQQSSSQRRIRGWRNNHNNHNNHSGSQKETNLSGHLRFFHASGKRQENPLFYEQKVSREILFISKLRVEKLTNIH